MRWEGWRRGGGDRWRISVCERESVYGLRNSESKQREKGTERVRKKKIDWMKGRWIESSVFLHFLQFLHLLTDAQSLCLLFYLWFLGCWRIDGDGNTIQSPSTAVHLDARAALTEVPMCVWTLSVCEGENKPTYFQFSSCIFCTEKSLATF